MSLSQLEKIRRFELGAILSVLRREVKPGGKVLDIGAGTGWQARLVSEVGYRVEAIDMPSSAYVDKRAFAIQDYDGHHIPFPDASFDAVYSSNVLEHVAHADAFQREILRVVNPDGVAVHVVPSSSWRFWSNFAHYAYMIKALFLRMTGTASSTNDTITSGTKEPVPRTFANSLRRIFIPNRDGEMGNALTEIWYFSRWRWARLFRNNGWQIETRRSNRLVYTGYYVLGEAMSIRSRVGMSLLLGGSCHVFVLRPKTSSRSLLPGKTSDTEQ